MKNKKVSGNSESKMYDNIGKHLDEKRTERKYENVPIQYNDLSLLVHQLAFYHVKDECIYKINVIDYTGQRYEVSGSRKSRWADFSHGYLFNFTDSEQFDYYYNAYKNAYDRPTSREKLLDFLKQSRSRMAKIDVEPCDDPVKLNNKRL
jgi:hypothetical protein